MKTKAIILGTIWVMALLNHLDNGDMDSYWVTFGMLLAVHQEFLVEETNKITAESPKPI